MNNWCTRSFETWHNPQPKKIWRTRSQVRTRKEGSSNLSETPLLCSPSPSATKTSGLSHHSSCHMLALPSSQTPKIKNNANNLFYICIKWVPKAAGTSVPPQFAQLPDSHEEPHYTFIHFFQISVSFLSKLICDQVFSVTWCYNTSTAVLISNIFIPLLLWQAPGSIATNIPVINELLSATDFTIPLLACGLWSNLNLYNPCIGSRPSSNNTNNTNKQYKALIWPQFKNTGQLSP